jgi:hypothetical protein
MDHALRRFELGQLAGDGMSRGVRLTHRLDQGGPGGKPGEGD